MHNKPFAPGCKRDRLPLLLLGMGLGMVAAGPVRAQIIADMPDAIVCSVKDPVGQLPWERLVFYVSASTVDGRTLYKTLTSDPVVLLVGADGVVSGGNLADCDGRSVQALVEDGRAFRLTPAQPSRPSPKGAQDRKNKPEQRR